MIEERRHSLVALALAIAAGIVLGALAVTAIFWVAVAIFHVVAWLLHVALVIGLITLAWWLLVGRRRHASEPA